MSSSPEVTARFAPEPGTVKTVVIDNYDSFTYNLVQYLQELGVQVQTVRNDALSVPELLALKPSFFVLSPGPSTPDQAGICLELIKAAATAAVPLLGVCLGHQAIGQAFGGTVERAGLPMHGKVSEIFHHQKGVFAGLPSPLKATRYHSLIVAREGLPEELEVTAWTADQVTMGLRHRSLPIEGVQFHPESVLTEAGKQMLLNFVRSATARVG